MTKPKVVIVDYGLGNLRSVAAAVSAVGPAPEVSSDPDSIRRANRIVLPGVGAFGAAAKQLETSGFGPAIRTAAGQGVPIFGICLGMQLLFDRGNEFGWSTGLGLIRGDVLPIVDPDGPEDLRGTHIGWRALNLIPPKENHPIWRGISQKDSFYFVHSFSAESVDVNNVLATVTYGQKELIVAVTHENVTGVQFHPEKSGIPGLRTLKNFVTA